MPNDQNKLPDQFVHRFLYCIWLLTPSFLLSLIFHRPIICVDVLAFPLLESRLNRLAIVVLRLTWTLLFVVYLFGSWNIFPISYGFYLNSIGAIPLSVLGLSAVMLCVLMAFIMLPPRRWGNPAIPRVLFVICTVLFLAKALLSLFLDSGGPPTVPISTAGPSAVKFVYQHPFLLQHSTTDVVDAGATTFAHYAAHTPRLPNKVVLMVVESWGETENNLALMKERFNANGIVVAQSGFKIFQGATLQGEFREICSTFVELSTPALDKALKQRCAPQFFRDRNYDVLGLHGYAKGFYARSLIWKNLGISESYFIEELTFLKHCGGPFPGICDADLIRHGLELMSRHDKAFLYMLTLGSHEPVPKEMAVPDMRYIGNIQADSPAQVVSRNAIIALVSQLEADQEQGCVMAYVVGDHQPPSLALMATLGNSTTVPYLVINFHCQPG